jgi:hypothetical protein
VWPRSWKPSQKLRSSPEAESVQAAAKADRMSNVAIVFGVMGTFSQVVSRNEALSCYGC